MSHSILGLNAYHGDSSAAILVDGRLEMAVEEERFNRLKHWAGLPVQAAAACLSRTEPGSLAHVAISRDPRAHFLEKIVRVATRPFLWRGAAGRVANGVRIAQTKQ